MEIVNSTSKKELLTQKNFLYLLSNQLISRIAEYLFFIGVVFYIYNQLSTANTSGVFIAKTLSLLLLSPIVGVIVDRYGRKKVMVLSTLFKAIFVLSIATVFKFSFSIYLLLYLYLVTFLLDACSLFFGTARSAIIPSIVKTEQLKTANSFLTLADDLIDTLGPTLASIIILAIGREYMPLLASIIFGISAVLITKIDITEELNFDQDRNFLEEIKLGLAFVRTSKSVFMLLLISGGIMIGGGIINVLLVPYSSNLATSAEVSYGVLLTALGAGFFIGSFLMSLVGDRFSDDITFILGLFMTALAPIMWSQVHYLPLAAAIAIFNGIANSVINISLETLFQKIVPSNFLGRVLSFEYFIVSAFSLISIGVGGMLADRMGVNFVLLAAGILEIIIALFAFCFVMHYFRKKS